MVCPTLGCCFPLGVCSAGTSARGVVEAVSAAFLISFLYRRTLMDAFTLFFVGMVLVGLVVSSAPVLLEGLVLC